MHAPPEEGDRARHGHEHTVHVSIHAPPEEGDGNAT